MCGRATNVILAPSAGCEGFARRSVTSVPARKAAQMRAKSRKGDEFQDRTLPLAFSAGFSRVGRPNLAYGYTFLARQEPKKSCIGNKDLAPFWRFCCGLLILIVKDEEFVLVNHGRTVITFTPGSYVLYIPKNRLWGPKNGPGAVSRRPETPRNSRTLRDRSRNKES